MASTIFIRGLPKCYLRAGSNGLCRRGPLGVPSELCRALAVAPFKAAMNSTTPQSASVLNFGASPLLKRVSPAFLSQNRSSATGDHGKQWTAERVLAITLLGAFPATVALQSPAMETFLALALTVHVHWGVESMVIDYIRPVIFGNTIPKLSLAAVYALSMATFGGLCYFIYTDVGLVNAVSLLWQL